MKPYAVKRNGQIVIEERSKPPHDAEYCDAPRCPQTNKVRAPYALELVYKTEEGRTLSDKESKVGAKLVAHYDPDKEKQYLERQAQILAGDIVPDLRAALPDFAEFIHAYLEERDGRPDAMQKLFKKYLLDKRRIK